MNITRKHTCGSLIKDKKHKCLFCKEIKQNLKAGMWVQTTSNFGDVWNEVKDVCLDWVTLYPRDIDSKFNSISISDVIEYHKEFPGHRNDIIRCSKGFFGDKKTYINYKSFMEKKNNILTVQEQVNFILTYGMCYTFSCDTCYLDIICRHNHMIDIHKAIRSIAKKVKDNNYDVEATLFEEVL